ncbi:uncharacterized protein K452DRAFT_260320 [Aplosporella prunicola CBS 121167]|uniref:Carrier domain-containing protein n=1 Tax=Aplosporella prunicola CBS 121167 TaxID=1176127 RepID=A0A6A6AUI0_9PEZI|nr:uncharacterized protein K452DRAFT_260320 [Aplosporella prunicola CBS 121167]KAF2135672.1 hypothetical protein K452DRAFT_260320 [Aplosporella prunicola CBS 121167]
MQPTCGDRLVHTLFQEHVRSRPNAPAIWDWDYRFTYRELDHLSSRLASHLSSVGVGPDVIVPILSDQSALGIAAMLAVSKAGGAFAALDTNNPEERLEEMIKDTQATTLLVSPTQSTQFSEIPGLSTVEIESFVRTASPESAPPQCNASPSDLMYTIWTSGSTGRPKGVMVPHRAFLTSALAYGADQGITFRSRVLQFASYAFDMSIMEIFTTLIFGGCVCVPGDQERFGGITDFVNRTGVNTLYLTPSYTQLLDPVDMPSVTTLVVGGEAVPSSLVEKWSSHVGVYIAYGLTETAIQAAGGWADATAPVTGLIGRPTGCRVSIVSENDHNELVRTGETGELLIEGPTLARGYLGDDEQTKASFVYLSESRRAYKTGDLVHQAPDGNIIYEGRKDTQIKIRGIRFELTEIEANLSRVLSPDSKICVEMVEIASQPRLAVFFGTEVRTSGPYISPAVCWHKVENVLAQAPRIRENLAKVLPASAIPSLYIPIAFIPLTSATKVDRRKLREILEDLTISEVQMLQSSAKSRQATRPWSAGESTMRELWALVLNREPESIRQYDNFIQLGGDSITSIRLVSAARERGLALTSSLILSTPVLSDLAEKAVPESEPESIEPFMLVPGVSPENLPIEDEVEDILPMTTNQMRWYSKTLVKPDAWLDQHHFRLPPDVDLVRFTKALNHTIAAAELLRARVVVVAGPERKLLQAIIKFHPVVPAVINDTLETYLKQDLQNPMGLGAPLSRYAIVREPDSSQIFVWTLHHAIYDGYSIAMLLQTIDDFYHGKHPAPFTPFNRYLMGPSEKEIAQGETFWKAYLGESSSWAAFPSLPPPEEKRAPCMQQFLWTMSLFPSPASAITAGTVIRVAYATALSIHSTNTLTNNDNSVLFLETLGGRNSTLPGIERIVGPTLLTCATKLRPFSASEPRSHVLADAQTSLIARIQHENFPLPRLLPLLPRLELRSLLMIEDADTFLATRPDGYLFGDGTSVLRLDEGDAMPVIFRCTIRGDVIDVDVRFDECVIGRKEVEAFVETFLAEVDGDM